MKQRFNREELSLQKQLGVGRATKSLGVNKRHVKRQLIKEYARYFTKSEILELKKMPVEEVNSIITLRAGKL